MNDKNETLAVLKETAKMYDTLGVEANSLPSNSEKMEKVLLKRANLIISLPTEIRKVSDDKTLLMEVDGLANMAKEITERRNGLFGLMAMLTPYGSKTGDPNLLEKLILKIEKK